MADTCPTRARPAILEIVCPNRTRPRWRWSRAPRVRLGITAKPRTAAQLGACDAALTPTPSSACSSSWAPRTFRPGVDRQALRRRGPGQGEPSGELRRRQHAPQREGRRGSLREESRQRLRNILGDDVPDSLDAAGELRLEHGDACLEELDAVADPPITKDAIAGRIRRLLQLAEKTAKTRDRDQSGASRLALTASLAPDKRRNQIPSCDRVHVRYGRGVLFRLALVLCVSG